VTDEPVGARPKAAAEGWTERVEFPEDVWEERLLLRVLRGMLERLMAQVRAAGVEIRRLTLELRYTDRAESRSSLDLPEPCCTEDDALPRLGELLRSAWTRRVRLRAMTLRAGRVYRPGAQLELFSPRAEERERQRRVAAVLDGLRGRFGPAALMRGVDEPLSSPAEPAAEVCRKEATKALVDVGYSIAEARDLVDRALRSGHSFNSTEDLLQAVFRLQHGN
jgi:hypothetical protein